MPPFQGSDETCPVPRVPDPAVAGSFTLGFPVAPFQGSILFVLPDHALTRVATHCRRFAPLLLIQLVGSEAWLRLTIVESEAAPLLCRTFGAQSFRNACFPASRPGLFNSGPSGLTPPWRQPSGVRSWPASRLWQLMGTIGTGRERADLSVGVGQGLSFDWSALTSARSASAGSSLRARLRASAAWSLFPAAA